MAKERDYLVRCHGCAHYFVTYDRHRPYGCAKFGFKTKSLPSQVVIDQLACNVHIGQNVRSPKTAV